MTDNTSSPGSEIPKMSDQLAAESDAAAIIFGKENGEATLMIYGDYDNSDDLTEGHSAGQSWMYRKLHSLLKEKEDMIRERDHNFLALNQILIDREREIAELKARIAELEDQRNSHY